MYLTQWFADKWLCLNGLCMKAVWKNIYQNVVSELVAMPKNTIK
jgi:hypothetical protein